ncbi:MAG: Smr/MutS family protein, partial [Candidatus Binataceae bacterium]
SAELADALKRLEEERARLRVETERLAERGRAFAAREAEALAAASRARAHAEAERERFRSEGAHLLEELRRDGAAAMEEIKTRAKPRSELSRILTKASDTIASLAPTPEQPREEDSAPLKVGDEVELGEIRGELLVLEPGRAVVARGGLRIEVSPERLRRARAAKAQPTREPTVTVTAAPNDRAELNLIGMRATEALRKLEEFLDQAYLTNRSEVRIVHGIGSGALKKAVHDYLSSSPYCAAFHQAEPHHGGAGATIVQLSA